MPFAKDFSTLTGRGTLDVDVPKWSSPLTVEYGYEHISKMLYFFWRVKGTHHTFRIDYPQLMQLTEGNYEEHISDFLKNFRQEYLGWASTGFREPWMREYHEQYKRFIEL